MPVPLIRRDVPIRLAGLALLCVGGGALRVLFDGAIAPGGWAGFAAAAGGFLGCSGGALFASLGAHIYDRVLISRPWASHRSD